MEVPEARARDPDAAAPRRPRPRRPDDGGARLLPRRAQEVAGRDRVPQGRGLSGEIAARYGLGYAPDGWQNLEAVFADYATAALQGHGPRHRFRARRGRRASARSRGATTASATA